MIVGFAATVGLTAFLVAWVVYLPVYLRMLKLRAPELYQRLGGVPFLGSRDALRLLLFLAKDGRLASDAQIARHSRMVLIVLFGGLSVGVGGAIYFGLKR